MDLADAKLVLDSIGFETVIIEAGKHVDVLSYNCPLKSVALRHQKLVCNHIHTELGSKLFQSEKVMLHECIALGDGFRRHKVIRRTG
jgi:hypothetical protein